MNQLAITQPLVPAFQQVSVEYNNWLANQISPETRRSYQLDCRQFFERFPIKHPADITIQDVITYRDELRSSGRQPSTIARKLSSVSSLFSWLKDQGVVVHNPVEKVRFPKVSSEGKTPGLSEREVRSLLDAPDPNLAIGNFHKAVLAMLVYTGMRRSELCGLKVSDLFEEDEKPVLRIIGKGEKERRIVLHLIAFKYLTEYLEKSGRSLTNGPNLT